MHWLNPRLFYFRLEVCTKNTIDKVDKKDISEKHECTQI